MARIDRLLAVMARLRDPQGGCPWDLEQTFATIAPYTLEEAYEVVEAIETGDRAGLRDELGDLLLQVVFHARMAEEAGLFAFDDVVDAIVAKMERRHPHVFGDETVASAAEQSERWEALKAAERQSAGRSGEAAAAGGALNLPALTRAAKWAKSAAKEAGDRRPLDVVEPAVRDLADSVPTDAAADPDAAVGDALLKVVQVAVAAGVDPEGALRRATRRREAAGRGRGAHLAAPDGA